MNQTAQNIIHKRPHTGKFPFYMISNPSNPFIREVLDYFYQHGLHKIELMDDEDMRLYTSPTTRPDAKPADLKQQGTPIHDFFRELESLLMEFDEDLHSFDIDGAIRYDRRKTIFSFYLTSDGYIMSLTRNPFSDEP